MWTTSSIRGDYIGQGTLLTTLWGNALTLASIIASMTVNALATGLIVFRIFKVFREVKDKITSDEKFVGFTGGRRLRSIIFIIIESGMILFAVQLARLVLSAMVEFSTSPTENTVAAYNVTIGIHEMLNVIISSVIVTLCFSDDVDLARV